MNDNYHWPLLLTIILVIDYHWWPLLLTTIMTLLLIIDLSSWNIILEFVKCESLADCLTAYCGGRKWSLSEGYGTDKSIHLSISSGIFVPWTTTLRPLTKAWDLLQRPTTFSKGPWHFTKACGVFKKTITFSKALRPFQKACDLFKRRTAFLKDIRPF